MNRSIFTTSIISILLLATAFLGVTKGFSPHNPLSFPILSPMVAPSERTSEATKPQCGVYSRRKRNAVGLFAGILDGEARSQSLEEASCFPNKVATIVVEQEERVPTTFAEAFQVFLLGSYNGPRMVIMLLFSIAIWRSTLAQATSLVDAIVVMAMVVYWCFQEHVLHGRVLHSEIDWYGKEIHETHHAKPYHHVSIDPAWLMLTWMGVVHVGLRCLLPLPLALSATLGYASSGLWYEFLHFIVHTRVRFRKGSYLQTMKDHHARHHLIDHNYWLGFSLPAVDDLFGTNPSVAEVRRRKKKGTRETRIQ